jgi:hypothetical protein
MIELEGRMISGLDEFMLRLGHLSVLCACAAKVGSSWFRITRETAKVLMRPIPVPLESESYIADYLRRKGLCRVGQAPKSKSRSQYRYPDLVVDADSNSLVSTSATARPEIWWQDFCLASPGVESRVGAITVAAKSGSKTGLSHITDWAQFVSLLNRAGELSPIGRVVTKLGSEKIEEFSNPYHIGPERIGFAFLILGADLDCFSRLAPKLLAATAPIRKSNGAKLFADAIKEIADEARTATYLSAGRTNHLYENLRDLENASRRGKKPLGSTSTAWHRTSSRLETYTDLGLLEKAKGGEEERFEYVYYPTQALERTVNSLTKAENARHWLEHFLVFALYGQDDAELLEDQLFADLPVVVSSLARPTGPVPIDAVAVGLVLRSCERGNPISIASARNAIENLAVSRSEIARLSRGGFGERAEFVSLDIKRLEELIA